MAGKIILLSKCARQINRYIFGEATVKDYGNKLQIHLLGLAMIFYTVVTVGFSSFFNLITGEAKKNVENPIMALEFVRKAADVEAIVKNCSKARGGLRTFLILDSFAFVPLYFAFLLLLSFFLSQAVFEWAKAAAVIVVAAASIAAIADWTENFYSYQALGTVFSNLDESVGMIFLAAHIKWVTLFVAVGILAAIFWRGGWWNIAASILFLSSAAGLTGLIFYRPLITLALLIQLLTIFVVGVIFMFPACRVSFLQAR